MNDLFRGTLTIKKVTSLFVLIFSVLAALVYTGCLPDAVPVTKSGFFFDTVISITLYETPQNSKKKLEDLLEECLLLARDYEKLFSKTITGSDVYRINHSRGESVTVSSDTIYLLEKALYYAALSQGAADPTIGSVSSLWNFRDNPEKLLPSPFQLEEAVSHVDYRAVLVDPEKQSVTLTDPEAQIDLGFIAKGYIADRIKEYLLEQGMPCGMINLGGNVVVFGGKPDGSPYQVGIQAPFGETGEAASVVEVYDASVVSSGNYERYFEKNGVLYHHILNPVTGYPVLNDLNSVTIISEHSVDGDALSTLVFVLGREKGMRLIESLSIKVSAILITNEGEQIRIGHTNGRNDF